MVNGAKGWCFTINNYSEEEYIQVINFLSDVSRISYAIVGKEVGDGGTPHLQGYAKFSRRTSLSSLKSEFNARAHYEVARGSARKNREYCSKGGEFTEFGSKPPASSKSRDELANEFRSAVRSGHTGVLEFSESNPGVYYFSGHNLLRNALSVQPPVLRPDIHAEWVYGAPGVGKSRYAHEKYPNAYIKDPRTKWWNGYLLEEEVIIDDFGPNGIDLNHLLRWFDRYKCTVETKGGMVPLYAFKFIVTSNFHPIDCFKDKFDVPHPQHDALMRRLVLKEM